VPGESSSTTTSSTTSTSLATTTLPAPRAGTLLGSTASGLALIDVDPTTGAGLFRAPQGAFGQVTDLEYRADGVLFGSTGGASSHIIVVDPQTGAETLVGTHVGGAVQALEFVGSTLYGAYVPSSGGSSTLVTVDQATGALTPIGLTGFGPIGGLAFDRTTGTMYGLTAGDGGGDLVVIDLATGAATSVGSTGLGDGAALEFGPDGTLYGGLGGASFAPGALISVDQTSGAGTVVGSTGFPRLSGLTFVPVGCVPAPLAGCIAPEKAGLQINEKSPGKEKLKVILKKLAPALTQSDFGDPSSGTTGYALCVYGQAGGLLARMIVDRAGDTCGIKPCWAPVSTKGYKYNDKLLAADGIQKIVFRGGDPGKGQVVELGKNKATAGFTALPTGIAPALLGHAQATVQILDSRGRCFGATLTNVKQADGLVFKAIAP
jgi:hypothetical protein